MKKRLLAALLCLTVSAGMVLTGCGTKEGDAGSSEGETAGDSGSEETKEISILWLGNDSRDGFQAVCDAAEEKLGIKVDIENPGSGEDGDNIVKTRLASGEMSDMLYYNSGSLLLALNPSEYFEDLSGESFMESIDDTFKTAVSSDGSTYGIPGASSQTGCILYNKEIYDKYKLEVPDTWDEFLENCKTLKDAGETALLGTFGDNWTAQVLYLGDHYNVNAENPNFAADFEAGKTKYASDEAGIKSFQKMEDVIPYYNSDCMATSYDDGCDMLMEGSAAQWVILSSALGNMYSLYGDDVNKIGCFGVPGENADDHGITVWEPNAIYANKDSENLDAVKEFMEFYVSKEGLDAYTTALMPNGPYCVKDYELPDSCYDAVKQMQTDYFDKGKTALALEFQTAVKGANCASICQELSSGQTNAKEAAARYDDDCKLQAIQLGLDWE